MPTLDPFVAANWIYRTLMATGGKTTTLPTGDVVSADAVAFCAGRITEARLGFEPIEFLTPEEVADGKDAKDCWPWIMYERIDGRYENFANELVLDPGVYRISAMMREEYLPPGIDIEDFNRPGFIAIQTAFQGVTDTDGLTGIVHESQILEPWKRLYGPRGQRISEMGVVARITTT